MKNNNRPSTETANQIALFITTEQESSTFTIQTRFAGIAGQGFIETSPGSGLYSRTEVARRGSFTFISLPAGVGGGPDIAVQTDGDTDTADRRKGVIIKTEDSTHELTVYVFNEEQGSADAYMAINCVEFPSAKSYQYFVFSSDYTGGESFKSQFLITPCEDNTTVSVRPSRMFTHPDWVNPSIDSTDPASTNDQDESHYNQPFQRFDTLMLSSVDDLTGTVITSDKPLSVFMGHQCGTLVGLGNCDYLVEQVPPHSTYGYLFFTAPFSDSESGELYRIGSLTNRARVTINCNCLTDPGAGNRVALQNSGPGVYNATVNRGQYVQCRTPENLKIYCCIQSEQPITVMGYTLAGPAMVYIPPVSSYLNSYSLTTAKNLTVQFQGGFSYILPLLISDNSTENRITVNGSTFDGYMPISCHVDGENYLCAYGATRSLDQDSIEIGYTNGSFWGFAYGHARHVSFAYPLAFEMEPIGCKLWILYKIR